MPGKRHPLCSSFPTCVDLGFGRPFWFSVCGPLFGHVPFKAPATLNLDMCWGGEAPAFEHPLVAAAKEKGPAKASTAEKPKQKPVTKDREPVSQATVFWCSVSLTLLQCRSTYAA